MTALVRTDNADTLHTKSHCKENRWKESKQGRIRVAKWVEDYRRLKRGSAAEVKLKRELQVINQFLRKPRERQFCIVAAL